MNSMNQSTFTLHSLPKVSTRGKKRAGRGYGSGKGGHTSGRGQKGQKSRRTIPWSFEGGALPLSQRLPFWRGKGRLHALKPKPVVVNIGDLERLKAGAAIDMALLIKEGFLTEKEARVQNVKILGRGKLTKKLTISGLAVSMPAKAKIEKTGGKVDPMAKTAETVGMVKMVKDKKSLEHKTIKRPTKATIKTVKKPAKKVVKKLAKSKRGTKKNIKKLTPSSKR